MKKLNHYFAALASLYKLTRTYYVLPLVAAVLAGYLNASGHDVLLIDAGLISVSVLFAGMAAWAGNEITDRFSDAKGATKSKWGLYVSGGTNLISNNEVSVRMAILMVLTLSTLSLSIASLYGFFFLSLVFSVLLIGFLYSVKPVRLKERGVFGLGSVALAYGVIAYSAGWVATGTAINIQSIGFGLLISVAFFGFEGLAYMIDYQQDFDNKENTIAVSLGYNFTKYLLAFSQIFPVLMISALAYFDLSPSRPNLFLIISLVLCTAIFSLSTIRFRKPSHLLALRVLGVPMIASLSLVFA